MGTGNILAAEIVKGGKSHQAYYYSQGKGDEESGSYYDQSGKSLQQKAGFNIEPVVYTRIHPRSVTGSTPFYIPSVCIPVLTTQPLPVRRLSDR